MIKTSQRSKGHSYSKVRRIPDKLRTYQSSRLRTRTFRKGDLVLRLIQEKFHKLAPQWEGPFIISEVIGGGAYRLKNPKTDEDVGNPWNVANLRMFYP